MDIKQHTVKSYDKDLESITETINQTVDLLRHSISMVENVFQKPQPELVERILTQDYKINQLDHLIERKVTTMLALRQPMAFDLRYIVSALKVSSNLERMGDKCKSIVKKVSKFDTQFDDQTKQSFLKMLEISEKMTIDAVLAFNTQDQEKAQAVLEKDDEIDKIYQQLFNISNGQNFSQEQVKNIINILFIAKSLERLADHATNIAEMVKYVVSGEVAE